MKLTLLMVPTACQVLFRFATYKLILIRPIGEAGLNGLSALLNVALIILAPVSVIAFGTMVMKRVRVKVGYSMIPITSLNSQ